MNLGTELILFSWGLGKFSQFHDQISQPERPRHSRFRLEFRLERISQSSRLDGDGSDIDLLVDALPGATLFDLGGLQDELESLLGVHVDLLTPGDLPLKFRAKVLAEAQPV